MVISISYEKLISTQAALDKLKKKEPIIYQKFLHIIHLTRQLQFGYQYMGLLLMDEEVSKFTPASQDKYVLSVYHEEINKFKNERKFLDVKNLLNEHQQISFVNISKLVLGMNPKSLVGPIIIH